jgi:arylesterase / paraoxonase
MSQNLVAAFNVEMQQTIENFQLKDYDAAYRHVERAHILGQRFFVGHWRTHYWMLRIALATSDRKEVLGQIIRLFAVIPGFVFGWVPVGNTGRSTISAIATMPIPDDLRAHFEGYDLKSIIAKRMVLLAIMVGFGALAL